MNSLSCVSCISWLPLLLPHLTHHARHLQSGLRDFSAAIVFRAETADARMLFFLEHENTMNDRDLVLNLDLCKRMRDAPTDVLGVAGFALENNAQANDRGK